MDSTITVLTMRLQNLSIPKSNSSVPTLEGLLTRNSSSSVFQNYMPIPTKFLLTPGALIGRSVSKKKKRITKVLRLLSSSSGDPPGDRTLDPNIKSVVLYQLS